MKKLTAAGVKVKRVTVEVQSETPMAIVEINRAQAVAFILVENCIRENFDMETELVFSD